jgi:uncharacterized protein (TIGR04141 family)
MDGLSVGAKVTLPQVPELLRRYLAKFHDLSYRERYPWVDQISEVTDKLEPLRLDALLTQRLRSTTLDRLWLAVPEIIDWARVAGFRYGRDRGTPLHDDLHIRDFLASLPAPESVAPSDLRSSRILCIGHEGDQVIDSWSAYSCLYCELESDGRTYVLNAGKWYRVAPDFVRTVTEHISRIPESSVELTPYDDDSETAYNQRSRDENPIRFALMDRQTIRYGGGQSQIEFCDLYDNERRLIHVKRYASSSALSQLCAQGVVSGELFRTDSTFRRLVNSKLPDSHRLADPERPPDSNMYEVVFAIISNSPGPLTLPLFSKINLRQAERRLRGFGYRVSLKKIAVRTRAAAAGVVE